VPVIEELNGWYKIQFNNNTGYVSSSFVSKKEPGSSSSERVLEGRKIVLDPGHGGFDSGAVGVNGIKEKDIVLNIARKLQSKLQQSGASVIITRSGDNYISLGNRVEQSNESKGHAFLSIHANSSTSSSASGVETHYYSKSTSTAKESKELAECMQQALIKELPANNRGVKDSSFQVIRQKSVPSVLVEIGFLSNKEEANRLADPQYQERIANALYNGFIQYFK
jgi:N-acetylmuramoyl-L-alanine amidase